MSDIEYQVAGAALVCAGFSIVLFRRWFAKEKKEMNEAWGMKYRGMGTYLIGATACGVVLLAIGMVLILIPIFSHE